MRVVEDMSTTVATPLVVVALHEPRRPAWCACHCVDAARLCCPFTSRRPHPKGMLCALRPHPANGGNSSELIANKSTGLTPSGAMPTLPQKLLMTARSRCSPPSCSGKWVETGVFGSIHLEPNSSRLGTSVAVNHKYAVVAIHII